MSARPVWLLDAPHDFDDALRLAPLVERAVWLPTQPLVQPWPVVEPGPLVAFGAMRTLRRLARHAPLAHAVLDDWSTLSCARYYPYVYPWLGRDAVFLPLSALAHMRWAERFGPQVFVRPDGNHKPFSAQLVDEGSVAQLLRAQQLHADELIVLSEPVRFVAEWRCWCRAGRVVTSSSYPGPPYGAAPAEALALAAQIAAALDAGLGAALYTVDVGALDDGRLVLVECGGVCSWGLYGCDLEAFVAACEAEASARWIAQSGAEFLHEY